ncbi:MAG TPA: GNAT family N-acetyltransferase [Coriobacteriia bacterium]|nr:GNAT family N-acetyltransferase [Coriobacteriia bacterium]
MGPIVVETERLCLRPWAIEDADEFAVMARDPAVVEYITGGRPLTDAEVAEFIERQMVTQEERGWSRWAVQLREPRDGEPAGVVGFCGPGCTFAPEVEVGWWLRAELWGRGLATEAGRAAVRHCFEVIGFPRLICCVHPDNQASRAVARKVGFRETRHFEYNGLTLVRHELENPLPAPPRDTGYCLDCVGASPGSLVSSGDQE